MTVEPIPDLKSFEVPSESRPRHIAIIMDGNGRWAEQRGLPRVEGHRRGVASVRRTVEACAELDIEQVTLYCLSSENWKRPQLELDFLMHLLQQYMIEERKTIMANRIRVCTIGRRDGIPEEVQQEIDKTIALSSSNTGTRLCLAINYGARQEMLDAMRAIAADIESGKLTPDELDESTLASYLYTRGMPDPDLVIRTAGEMRLSNFLLWQISYAELWMTQRCWPDFAEADLLQAIRDFARRERRFGGLPQRQPL